MPERKGRVIRMLEMLENGAAATMAGLIVTFVGALWAARGITMLKGPGWGESLRIGFDQQQVKRGLWTIAAGTLLQFVGTTQAVLTG